MTHFSKQNLSDIAIEDAHGGSGARQMLLDNEVVASKNWEAVTKGFLPKGAMFDWHKHDDSDEIFIVTKGTGMFFCDQRQTNYQAGDIITVKANIMHKIENTGDDTTEGFFIRVKVSKM